MNTGFYVFVCTYISTFVLDWILETGYLKKNVMPIFFLYC